MTSKHRRTLIHGTMSRGTDALSPVLLVIAVMVVAGCAGGLPIPRSSSPSPSSTSSPVSASSASAHGNITDLGASRRAVVVDVVDGDTVDVRFRNGETGTVRLLGVDAPETARQYQDPAEYGIPNTSAGRCWLRQWGEHAARFTERLIAGEQITVVFDARSSRRGYYGRLLAYIVVDGRTLGARLLQQGLARVYTGGEFSLTHRYQRLEAHARAENRGLWDFEATGTPISSPTSSRDGAVPTPGPDGDYDCGMFDTRRQVEAVFTPGQSDPHRLDADGDGNACESVS